MQKAKLQDHFTLWKVLRLCAIATLVLIVYQVVAEASALNQKIVWLKDKFLELTWEPPMGGSDHYRIQILKTDLLAEPVMTSLFYEYCENNQLEVELLKDHSYSFRVQAVSSFGALSDYSEETSLYILNEKEAQTQTEETTETPSEFSLSQNYPNPFNNATTIEYQIPRSGTDGENVRVRLEIYNMLGQRVKQLVNEVQQPDEYSVTWDGRSDNGIPVASANYVYQLIAGNRKVSKKMIYLK